nr:reverse transcriptase domain-containing protein [Tanacetum cinerariifolium]
VLEDHVKIFQAAAHVECWAMPTWCHMFNSTLIGTARVWFDELPPESIDGYKDFKSAFLAYFMQQKKGVGITIRFFDAVGAVSTSRTISARRIVPFMRTSSTVGIISRVFYVRPELSHAWR